MPVDFIVQSKNPYPDWLKTHTVFSKLDKLDKIFPKIGLPNFKDEIEVSNSTDATNYARALFNDLYGGVANKLEPLRSEFVRYCNSPNSRERNEKCNKLQRVYNIANAFYSALSAGDAVEIANNKANLILRRDVFDGGSSHDPVFKRGQSLLKCFSTLNDLLKEVGITTLNYEGMNSYKSYSQFNVPTKKYTVYFASDGAEGAWDIATASMRGITSCQAWTSAQSRGLIGSISSKYLGILYITSDSGVNEYKQFGSKMICRCMVRLAIHKTTGEPTLVLDRMYPNPNIDFSKAFKKLLTDRSGLKVVSHTEGGDIAGNYTILDEESRTFLKQGEFSYMDIQMPLKTNDSPISKYKQQILLEKNQTTGSFEAAQKNLIKKISAVIEARREKYVKYAAQLENYYAEKAKFEEQGKLAEFTLPEPQREDSSFHDAKKGQFAPQNLLNFFEHCDRRYGKGSATSKFLETIFQQMDQPTPNAHINTPSRVYRYMLLQLAKNKDLQEKSWNIISTGSWSKSFSKSSKRFFETLFDDLKQELHKSWRDSI